MKRDSVESRIRTFLAKYSPDIAKQLRAARARLRALLPRGYELVYDNYNALVFGFSPSDRSSEAFISVAGYPRWITLFFLRGVDLDDPHGLLEGSGKQVRGIRLGAQRKLTDPAVRALVDQAIGLHRDVLRAAAPLRTLVKAVSLTQRPRRPASATASRNRPRKRDKPVEKRR